MQDNNNNLNLSYSYKKDKNKLNMSFNKSIDKKSSHMNSPNDDSSSFVKSKFLNADIKKPISKKIKSIDLSNKNYLENLNEEKNSMVEIKKKFKNSLIFTGRKLKEKIEKKLSVEMDSEIKENLEKSKKGEDIKDNNISNRSMNSFNSVIKRKIEKSMINKNLKRRRRISNDKLIKERIRERNRNIFQIKHVYDSLEDSEENYNSTEETFFISPESKFIFYFDLIIILCLILCIIYIPLKISFQKNKCMSLNIFDKIVFNFIDIIYIIDLVIGFYRGFYNSDFKLISNIKIIMKNYLSTYFFYDLLSALPCCSFLIYYYTDICFSFSNNNQYLFILIISITKLFKCAKIRKNNKFIEGIYELFSKNFLAEQIYGIMKMIIITFSILHIFVCCHIFIGNHFYPSWLFLLNEKYTLNDYISIYIASLYFLITTLTTVGYGDIVCISFPERIFQLIELSLGVIFYSYIISKFGDYVKAESYSTMVYNNNSAILEDIRISHPKMPFKLYNQIKHHLQTNLQQQKKSDINLLINSLPHALKYTLLFVINKNYVNKFDFFKKCYNSNFIAYSLINFVPTTYKKNTLIIKEDELMDNTIFIIEGRLSLEIAIDLESPEDSIEKYLNKNYNPLKKEGSSLKNDNMILNNKLTSIDIVENKKNDVKDLKTFLTNYTGLMKEKGIELTKIEREFDESNYHFLNVTNIFKNEHYGEVFITLNKPSPLFLRVKSKKANLFLLNKKHILHLSENFTNIWKRLFNKSLKNMRAIKHKTIDVAKKYSKKYNISCISTIINKKGNIKQSNFKTKNERRNSQIDIAVGSLQNFITKNIREIKQVSSISENINVNKKDNNEGKEDIKNEEETKITITNLEKKNEDIKAQNTKKSFNKYSNKENMNLKSKTIDFMENNKFKPSLKSSKLLKQFSSNFLNPTHYTMKNLDSKYIKKVMEDLEKQIQKRNHYLKLLNESNKKIKNLYSQLVNTSIDITKNIDKIGILDTQIINNVDLSKIVLNNINNEIILSPPSNKNKSDLNIRNISINNKNMNKKDKNILSSCSLKSNKKTKSNINKRVKKKISKFNIRNDNKIEKIFINLNQPVLIFNTSKSFDKKENKDKIGENIYNKCQTLTKKNNYIKDNIFKKNYTQNNILNNDKENKSQINILSFISDNSQNSIIDSKILEKNSLFESAKAFMNNKK